MNFELPPPIPPKREGAPRVQRRPNRKHPKALEESVPPRLSLTGDLPPPPSRTNAPDEESAGHPIQKTPESSSAAWAVGGGILVLLMLGLVVVAAVFSNGSSSSGSNYSANTATPVAAFQTPTPAVIPESTPDSSSSIVSRNATVPEASATPANTPLPDSLASQLLPSPTPSPTPNTFDQYASNMRQAALAAATPLPITYRVSGISNGDYLNMREGPSASSPIVHKLANGVDGITTIGEPITNGETTWRQISCRGSMGWVNADFLSQYGGSATPSYPASTSTAQSYPAATPFISTTTVSWGEQSYTVDVRYAAAINAKIDQAHQYVARYVALKGEQSDLQLRLSRSGPFGKKRLSDALATTTADLKKTQREGDAVIADMLQLVKQGQIH